ncbi:MAG: TSCPD domain-containing protein [Dehalococcoidia bacterium]|nr:TSCPD domain-containing protein [Dehalococcoidia bacterium]
MRPEVLDGKTIRVKTGCGNAYITVATGEGYIEVLAVLGKNGGCPAAFMQSITRLVTVALNHNVPAEKLIRQLNGIRCPNPAWGSGRQILSCPDAIAKVLAEATGHQPGCPDCGTTGQCNCNRRES